MATGAQFEHFIHTKIRMRTGTCITTQWAKAAKYQYLGSWTRSTKLSGPEVLSMPKRINYYHAKTKWDDGVLQFLSDDIFALGKDVQPANTKVDPEVV